MESLTIQKKKEKQIMKLEEKKIQPRSYSNKKEYHSFLKQNRKVYHFYPIALFY